MKYNIYIGSQKSHELIIKVLEYSLKINSRYDVNVFPIYQNFCSKHKPPVCKKNLPGTSFSFQRFIIPEIMSFKGLGLYLDSDMIVFEDIKDLFDTAINDNQIYLPSNYKRTGHTSVMLINSSKCNWKINDIIKLLDEEHLSYKELMQEVKICTKIGTFNKNWNCLDVYNNDTKLLHFTNMSKQPWLSAKNHLAHHWFKYFFKCIDEGIISMDMISSAINNNYVRPSVLYQIDNNILNPLDIEQKVLLEMDYDFTKFCINNNWNNLEGNYTNHSLYK